MVNKTTYPGTNIILNNITCGICGRSYPELCGGGYVDKEIIYPLCDSCVDLATIYWNAKASEVEFTRDHDGMKIILFPGTDREKVGEKMKYKNEWYTTTKVLRVLSRIEVLRKIYKQNKQLGY